MKLRDQDPALAEAIANEEQRQKGTLELIASENFVSPAVLEAQGSVMTNKYAEGLPKKRYYGGCEFVDVAEELAIARKRFQSIAREYADAPVTMSFGFSAIAIFSAAS